MQVVKRSHFSLVVGAACYRGWAPRAQLSKSRRAVPHRREVRTRPRRVFVALWSAAVTAWHGSIRGNKRESNKALLSTQRTNRCRPRILRCKIGQENRIRRLDFHGVDFAEDRTVQH